MRSFTKITEQDWIRGDYRPMATLAVTWQKLSRRLAVKYDTYDTDGLGLAYGAFFKTNSGLQFMIEHLVQAPGLEYHVNIYGLNHVSAGSEGFDTDHLEQILEATGIKFSELTWTHDSIAFQPHEVWREAKNGKRFLVAKTACRADANRIIARKLKRGYKQKYSASPAKQ